MVPASTLQDLAKGLHRLLDFRPRNIQVRYQPHGVPVINKYPVFLEALRQALRPIPGQPDVNHVRLHSAWIELAALELREAFCQEQGIGMILRQSFDVILQGVYPCSSEEPALPHAPSHHLAPTPGLGNETGLPGKNRADRRPQTLGETYRNTVKGRCDFPRAPARPDRRIEEPCTIQMET